MTTPLPHPSAGFSLVIPFYNEEDNVAPVLEEAREKLPLAELVAIDDGSSDRTWEEIQKFPEVRAVRFVENRGQSAAVYYGLTLAKGPVVGMMDGDGQNVPESFLPMLQLLRSGGRRGLRLPRDPQGQFQPPNRVQAG